MRVLVTGADGFIGRNLCVHLRERGHVAVPFTRVDDFATLPSLLSTVDGVAHLAGANRPLSPDGFKRDNRELTEALVAGLASSDRPLPVVFASSAQATLDNPYGRSKLEAELALAALADAAPVIIMRLPNVFGKWARPFYNSAVATFCHQAARSLPLSVNDAEAPLALVHVDDVVAAIIAALAETRLGLHRPEVGPVHRTTVGEVAAILERLVADRRALRVGEVGSGLERALYATLLTYLETHEFAYDVPVYGDARGRFVEVVKTASSGQFSYFTQVAGVERGSHYHHSKSEKFLVVRGRARFRFRHLITGERVDVEADAAQPRIVDTIPGWTHDVQNLGEEEMIVLVWANEVFDRERPDTVPAMVEPAASEAAA